MNKLSLTIIGAVAIFATACSDNKEQTDFPSAPLTLTTNYGLSRSVFDVADVTAVIINENGRISTTPLSISSCSESTPSAPEGFLNAGASVYGTLIRNVNALIPNDNTQVAFMLAITPKKDVLQNGAAIEMIAASHFNLTDKFGTEFIATTKSFVQTSVTADILNDACIALSNNCTFTYAEKPDGTYGYATIYSWREIVDLTSTGDLSVEEIEQITNYISDNFIKGFGTRRWSHFIANAIFNERKTEVITNITSFIRSLKSENTKPIKLRYYFLSDYTATNADKELSEVFTVMP